MWPFSTPYPERNLESVDIQEFDFIVVGGESSGLVTRGTMYTRAEYYV